MTFRKSKWIDAQHPGSLWLREEFTQPMTRFLRDSVNANDELTERRRSTPGPSWSAPVWACPSSCSPLALRRCSCSSPWCSAPSTWRPWSRQGWSCSTCRGGCWTSRPAVESWHLTLVVHNMYREDGSLKRPHIVGISRMLGHFRSTLLGCNLRCVYCQYPLDKTVGAAVSSTRGQWPYRQALI